MSLSWLLLYSLFPLFGLPCHGEIRRCTTGQPGLAGVGECRDGTMSCIANQWGPCLCGQGPKAERCDCKDNNCDGQIDESCACGCPGQTRSCGFSTEGQCLQGTQICVGQGHWSICRGTIGPNQERCDQRDNDCDGKVDEDNVCDPCKDGDSRNCFTYGAALLDEGPCRAGTETCQGSKWGACVGQQLPEAEICDNIDNDCNGFVDGQVRLCGANQGVCQQGSQTCELGKWGDCKGEVKPALEVCDCQDNDCDGTVDEDVACPSGEICFYGRCVPNCANGKCLHPSEMPREPNAEPGHEPSLHEPPEGPSTSDANGSNDVPEPRLDTSAQEPLVLSDLMPDGAGTTRERIPAPTEADEAREGTSGKIEVSVGGCGCDARGRGVAGVLWGILCLFCWLLFGKARRSPAPL